MPEKKWKLEFHENLIRQKKHFNPGIGYGLTDQDNTFYNNQEVHAIYHSWKQNYGNNIAYFGEKPFKKPDCYDQQLPCRIYKDKIMIGGSIFNYKVHSIQKMQKKLLNLNLKSIVYDRKNTQVIKEFAESIDNFVKIYPTTGLKPKFKEITAYSLVYGNIKEEYINNCIIGSLYQRTNFPYKLKLLFVLDPPCRENRFKIEKVINDIGTNIKYEIICNPKYLNYTGSYLRCIELLDGDFAINTDIDDMSSPERLFWSNYYFEQDKSIKCLGCTPVLCENTELWKADSIESCCNPHFYDPFSIFCESVLFPYRIAMNPQTWSVKVSALKKVRLDRKKIINCLLGGDQLILNELLFHYPLGCMNIGKALLYYRVHDESACKSSKEGFYIDKARKVNRKYALDCMNRYKQEQRIKILKKWNKNKEFKIKLQNYLDSKGIPYA